MRNIRPNYTTARLAACSFGVTDTIHAGSLVTRDGWREGMRAGVSYAPSCKAGRRRERKGWFVPTAPAVRARVNCRNCLDFHTADVAAVHADQDARADRDEYLAAMRITEHAQPLLAGLAATICGMWPAESLTRSEVDALALALLAGGHRDKAEVLIASHAWGDEPDDAHHLPGDDVTCEQANAFAAAYVRDLMIAHADGQPCWVTNEPHQWGYTWTVTVSGPEADAGESPYAYVLRAPDASKAAAAGWLAHMADMSADELAEATLIGDTPTHTVGVTSGLPTYGHANDLRNFPIADAARV